MNEDDRIIIERVIPDDNSELRRAWDRVQAKLLQLQAMTLPNWSEIRYLDFSTPANFPPEVADAIRNGHYRGSPFPRKLLNQSGIVKWDKARAAAYAELVKAVDASCLKWVKAVDASYAKLVKAQATAYAKLDKARAAAGWKLFSDPQNRAHAWWTNLRQQNEQTT